MEKKELRTLIKTLKKQHSKEQLAEVAKPMAKNDYGKYLLSLIK